MPSKSTQILHLNVYPPWLPQCVQIISWDGAHTCHAQLDCLAAQQLSIPKWGYDTSIEPLRMLHADGIHWSPHCAQTVNPLVAPWILRISATTNSFNCTFGNPLCVPSYRCTCIFACWQLASIFFCHKIQSSWHRWLPLHTDPIWLNNLVPMAVIDNGICKLYVLATLEHSGGIIFHICTWYRICVCHPTILKIFRWLTNDAGNHNDNHSSFINLLDVYTLVRLPYLVQYTPHSIHRVYNTIESCRLSSSSELASIMFTDVNRTYILNPLSSSIFVLGCAILSCVISIFHMRLCLAINYWRHLFQRASVGIASDRTLIDAWSVELFLWSSTYTIRI